nr:ribosomal protein L31 [Microheliella maris]BDN85846.1 ribosomal protein L31 [Microheliella maris]
MKKKKHPILYSNFLIDSYGQQTKISWTLPQPYFTLTNDLNNHILWRKQKKEFFVESKQLERFNKRKQH